MGRFGNNRDRYGDRNPNAKMTWELVAQLREAHAGGEGVVSLAQRFRLHHSTVSDIVSGRAWKGGPVA